MTPLQAAAAGVFAITFIALAFGKFGKWPVPRGVIALCGGIVTALLLRVSLAVINLDIILLLSGLMVLAALAETAGLFAGFRHWLITLPAGVALWVCLGLMAITSALLLNDAAVVVLVPFLVPALRHLGIRLVPAVVLLAVAANLGSLLTPFGNPQNAVLASHARLGILDFVVVQGPLVALGLALLAAAAWWVGRTVVAVPAIAFDRIRPRGRLWVAVCLLGFVLGALVAPTMGWGLGILAAATAAVTLLGMRGIVGREAEKSAWRGLDWNVLALFVGLYLLTGGLGQWFPAQRFPLAALDSPLRAALGTTALSLSVGNVPAILTFVQLDPAWTRQHAQFLVTVSTLGGAMLLTGSAASLLAADAARKLGIEVGFMAFMRWAVPCTLPLVLLGAWLTWQA